MAAVCCCLWTNVDECGRMCHVLQVSFGDGAIATNRGIWLKSDGVAALNGRRRTLASTDGILGEKETAGCCRAGKDHPCGSLSAKAAGKLFPPFFCLYVGTPELWDWGLVNMGPFLLWFLFPTDPIARAQARARITGGTFLVWLQKELGFNPLNHQPKSPTKGYLEQTLGAS